MFRDSSSSVWTEISFENSILEWAFLHLTTVHDDAHSSFRHNLSHFASGPVWIKYVARIYPLKLAHRKIHSLSPVLENRLLLTAVKVNN